MKRMLFALLLITVSMYTAAHAESRLLAGVRVGPNLADIKTSMMNGALYKPKPGLLAGVSVEWMPNYSDKHLTSGVRLDVMYAEKGWTDRVIRTDEHARNLGWFTAGTVYINELVVSPLYVLRIPVRGFTPFVQLGPEFGFNLSAKEILNSEIGGGESKNPWGWKKDPNLSLNAGVGVAMPMKGGEGSLDVRYNLGLTNMSGSPFAKSIKTNGIQLVVGYSFAVPEI